jgi:hypothetical protein
MNINDAVNTPVGPGKFVDEIELYENGIVVETVRVVEVPVTDLVKRHLKSKNCLTPSAKQYAKFEFPPCKVTLIS